MTKTMIGLLMAGALVVAGCDDKKAEGGKDGKSGASGDAIGVAECDEYFKKMEECFSKTPAMKAAMGDAMKQNKDAWKQAAATPQGKESLKTTCKAATDAIAQSCK
jgi:hypothetical protein